MANVKIRDSRYKVDSLYQWDKNQVLQINGLSLESVPEIHFKNVDMERAIVRQSTMNDSGIITVDVPNSLLQKPYMITAYICVYENSTFRSLYSIEIPVIARNKPYDYTIEDTHGEIYSFNALENMVQNALKVLYSDRSDTLSEVMKINNNAVNEMKKTNEAFNENLAQRIEDSNNELSFALNKQYENIAQVVETHISDVTIQSETRTGTVPVIVGSVGTNGEATYEAIWSKQGNIMNLTLSLSLPANAWGSISLTNNGLTKPDWFEMPNFSDSYFMIPGAKYDDYLSLRKTNSEIGYAVMVILSAERATDENTGVAFFNTSYIVSQ